MLTVAYELFRKKRRLDDAWKLGRLQRIKAKVSIENCPHPKPLFPRVKENLLDRGLPCNYYGQHGSWPGSAERTVTSVVPFLFIFASHIH